MYLPIHILLGVCILVAQSSLGIRTADDIPKRFIANKNCRVIISELNVFPAGGSQYVELMRVCTPSPKNVFNVVMGGKYKLAFIDHSGFLIGVCTLKKEAFRRSGAYIFYVVGGSAVPEADMKFEECDFADDADYYSPNLMPYADKAPVAVALVYHPRAKLQWLELKKEGRRISKVPMTKDMQTLIIPNIVDMYIYTTSSPHTGCDHFETYYKQYKSQNNVVVRDWAHPESDLSISRCNSLHVSEEVMWDPMQPDYMVYAKKSPGDLNNCQRARRFRIEDTQPPRIPPVIRYRTTPEYSCYITTMDPFIDNANLITNPANYRLALEELFSDEEMEANVDTTPEAPAISTEVPNTMPQPISQRLFEDNLEKSIPHIWDSCDKFGAKQWISSLRNCKNPYIRPQDVLRTDVCYWIDYLAPEQFTCKLCRQLWNQKIVFDRPGSHLLRAVKKPRNFRGGTSKSTKYKNRRLILDHMDTAIHKIAIDFFELLDNGLRGDDLNTELYRDGGPLSEYLKSTTNKFVAVYQANRLDIPFYKYPLLARLLEFYGVDIGFLYQNPLGAKQITMSISKTMHSDFAEDLLRRKPDVSVMIDTATDVSSISSLAILLQTYDQERNVTVKLYRLMKSPMNEGGQELFDMFTKSLEEDGLSDYVKEKVIGFASDGGSNVRKFRRLLTEWSGRDDLYLVHCYAHKLDLVLKHAWSQSPFLKEIDEMVNALHRLFNSKSHKKKELLHRTAEELGDTKFELKRVIPTRWVSSKLRAFETVLEHWKTIVKATEYVLADKTTKGPQRANAEYVLSQMKDPTLIITTAFITDACRELSTLSLLLQERGTTLISKKERRTKLKQSLEQLKSVNGKWVQWALDNSKIHILEGLQPQVISLEEFEGQTITLDGVEMAHSDQKNPSSLYTERSKYLDDVLEEIAWYFPEDPTDNLDIFDPTQWTRENLLNFGNVELLNANLGLKWRYAPAQVLQDWIDLKTQIHSNADFRRLVKKTPEDFWAYFLTDGSGIEWPESMRKVVTNLLVVPASTAEVERIFSIYNNVKTVKRYNLDVSTVEAIVRIKFNGPKALADFDAAWYVKQFILDGHSRSDDSSSRRTKRPRSEDSDSDDSESGPPEDWPNESESSEADDSEAVDRPFDFENEIFTPLVTDEGAQPEDDDSDDFGNYSDYE